MFQQVELIGNVGKVEDMRFTQNGKGVINFSLAVNEGGGENKTTLWLRITAWEKLAEIVAQYVVKGKQVFVVGRLMPANAYLTKDGKPAASYEVVAEKIRLLGTKDDAPGNGAAFVSNSNPTPDVTADIPF